MLGGRIIRALQREGNKGLTKSRCTTLGITFMEIPVVVDPLIEQGILIRRFYNPVRGKPGEKYFLAENAPPEQEVVTEWDDETPHSLEEVIMRWMIKRPGTRRSDLWSTVRIPSRWMMVSLTNLLKLGLLEERRTKDSTGGIVRTYYPTPEAVKRLSSDRTFPRREFEKFKQLYLDIDDEKAIAEEKDVA